MTATGQGRVLVVAAHPDDETLGCGGSIARYADQGQEVHVLFMTNGISARADAGEQEATARREAAARAGEILGIQSLRHLDFPDNRMDTVALLDVVQAIEKHLQKLQPEIVLTHFPGDLNIDHRITAQATATACRPLPGSPVHELLAFEVCSSTEWGTGSATFQPQRFVDIEASLERKLEALAAYGEEMPPAPHARSAAALRALATRRGHSVGLHCAEAFQVLRSVQPPVPPR